MVKPCARVYYIFIHVGYIYDVSVSVRFDRFTISSEPYVQFSEKIIQ